MNRSAIHWGGGRSALGAPRSSRRIQFITFTLLVFSGWSWIGGDWCHLIHPSAKLKMKIAVVSMLSNFENSTSMFNH